MPSSAPPWANTGAGAKQGCLVNRWHAAFLQNAGIPDKKSNDRMNAITVNKNTLEMDWNAVPNPVMKADEVLVHVHAAGLNRADLLQRQGKYPPPTGAPEWMGLEVAGVITQVGYKAAKHFDWQVGDSVCALLAGGGYAEQVAIHPAVLLPVPKGLSMAEAASLPEVFATAYLNLFMEAELQAGERVLIHAGASGLGIAAIQLCKAFGADVVTTVGSPEKAEALNAYGADIIVERNTTDLDTILDQCEAEGRPVNVALDCVGGANLGKHLSKLARGGRWILVGTLGGITSDLSLRPLLTRGLRLIGSTLRSRPMETKARLIRELTERVWPKIESGAIRPFVHKIFPIAGVTEAHAVLDRNENIGKVVLLIER